MSIGIKNVGFIGCGNMSECIMAGVLESGFLSPKNVYVSNRTIDTMKRLHQKYGVHYATPVEVAKMCDLLVIGVKPYGVTDLLDVISPHMNQNTILVSVAAGVTIETIMKHMTTSKKVIRAMPNVPCFVGCGMTSISPNEHVTPEEVSTVEALFATVGKAIVLPESSIHGVIGACGSSPAFVFMFIEALSDGCVRCGVPRKLSYEMATQAVLGAAKMMQESGKPPSELKDMVSSPAGATIEGIRSLEKDGMRSAVIEAVCKTVERSKEMEKENTK